jgi:purine-binding chemotaxis protein CheW
MQSNGTTVVEAAETRVTNRGGKYLTFQLAQEEYAIRVLQVREIMGLQHITAVPQTPVDMKGVINLRGKVIPVSDLRVKFGLPDTEYTPRTCIIVVQLHGQTLNSQMEGDVHHVGVIVDQVSEVLNLQEADIQDTPDFGRGVSIPYLLGMAKVKGKVKILLDIDRVMDATDLKAIETLIEQRDAEN